MRFRTGGTADFRAEFPIQRHGLVCHRLRQEQRRRKWRIEGGVQARLGDEDRDFETRKLHQIRHFQFDPEHTGSGRQAIVDRLLTRAAQQRRKRSENLCYRSPICFVSTCGNEAFNSELKKGSTEFLILSLIEDTPRHGYEIAKMIDARSEGALTYQVASLYPLLYRLEARGWIQGRWVEKAGQRRRRYYRLTPSGKTTLAAQRQGWQQFATAIRRITGIEYA